MLIGFGYSAQVGKSTASAYLTSRYNFKELAFASPLKKAVASIFGFSDEQLCGHLKEEIDEYWHLSPRDVLQRFGTDLCRAQFGDDIWVKTLFRQLDPSADVVISDVRFPNEAQAIKDHGGILINIIREGGPGTTHKHISESAMDGYTGWNHTLYNNGLFSDLYEQIDDLMKICH